MKLMFRVDEVAEMLSVSPKTVYRMVSDGHLLGLKVGKGSMRIRADVLAAYIDHRSQLFVLENGFNLNNGQMRTAIHDTGARAMLTYD